MSLSKLKTSFIKATEAYTTMETAVPAPYLRKVFTAEKADLAKIRIACCGFYRLFLNGKELTRGFLSPYISNPNHYVYYDEYEAPVAEGENVLGLMLGNGFQNCPGSYIWLFDEADFRSAPAVSLTLTFGDTCITTDSSFRTNWSPIFRDDYRWGEIYDAGCEQPGWNLPGFDDSKWHPAIRIDPPAGELRFNEVEPIVIEKELKPVAVFPASDGGYIYDFGEVNAGICRLTVKAAPYQPIHMQHAEVLKDGTVDLTGIWYPQNDGWHNWDRDKMLVHKDIYVSKGEGTEVYTPSFTYHGFRYVRVTGITEEQATPDLLTYLVIHTELKTVGGFTCDHEIINRLQEATRRSDASNLHHIPTDCPQREKNGWTADAALSAEQILLNFSADKVFTQWIRSVCKAQNEQGALPGIVPTSGWGFDWGNGPAWDCALVVVPYYLYTLRGDTTLIAEIAPHVMKYLRYIQSRMDEKGLVAIGLGDWCQVNANPTAPGTPKAPLVLTDSIMVKDIARKAAVLFEAVGLTEEQNFCKTMAQTMVQNIRTNLIDFDTLTAAGNCQSSQAMCIYYGIFTEAEQPAAFEKLLSLIHEAEDCFDVGVLGARVLFETLSRFGQTDLALQMIVGPQFPSYGFWLAQGATTLWEDFMPDSVRSANHHFWGHISGWFITHLAGIRLIDPTEVRFCPEFASALNFAEGRHEAPAGKIVSRWERKGDGMELTLTVPEAMTAEAVLPKGWQFADGTGRKTVKTGIYAVKKDKKR